MPRVVYSYRQLEPGEVSTFKYSPIDAMESHSSSCSKGGSHIDYRQRHRSQRMKIFAFAMALLMLPSM
eukprot:jgi/Tetstr1/455500/TSEL_042328.t1